MLDEGNFVAIPGKLATLLLRSMMMRALVFMIFGLPSFRTRSSNHAPLETHAYTP